MLSIEKTKELINDENITDEEARKIRDDLYLLAELALESYFQDKQNTKAED